MAPFTMLAVLVSAPAHAEEPATNSCLLAKIGTQHEQGYTTHTATTMELAKDERHTFVVTMDEGKEYVVQACGGEAVTNLDIVIQDGSGTELSRDKTDDREPVIRYTPSATASYTIVVHAAALSTASASTGIAVAYK